MSPIFASIVHSALNIQNRVTGSRRATVLRSAALVAAVLLTASCATGVRPIRPDLVLPPAYDAAARNELPPAVLDQWWLAYEDDQLSELVERAYVNGFSSRDATARLEEALAIRSGALSGFNPKGDLQASIEQRHSRDIDSDDESPGGDIPGLAGTAGRSRTGNLTLPVSWEIDLFGRRAATRDAVDADLAQARFEYEATQSALVAEVARSLFQARGLSAQLDDARANARIQRELQDLLERRVEYGLAAASSADRVAADVAQADASALELESEFKAARRALLVVLGDGLQPLESLQISNDLLDVPAVPHSVPGELLVRRPDVRRADARIRAAAGNVQLAELDFFPRLTLQSSAGLSAQRGSFARSTSFWSFGLGLTVPILDRPRLSAVLRAESARGQQAVIAYEKAVQTAYSEADQALTRLQSDRGRITLLVDGEASASRAYEAARKRFDLGFSDLQTLLDTERVWRSARTALTDARTDALLRSVQAFQALGGGWSEADFDDAGQSPNYSNYDHEG